MRRSVLAAWTALVTCLALAGCAGGTTPHLTQVEEPKKPATVTVTPAAGTADAPISTEIGFTIEHGKLDAVRLVKSGTADEIGGSLRADGSTWVPAQPLEYGASYDATVTATGEDGQPQTQTTTFTTMKRPSRQTGTGLYLFDGQTAGVAIPLVIDFDQEIPESARPEIQKRLFVTSDPPQPGVWSWDPNGRQVFYRPPTYWQTGTKITLRAALAGVPTGNGYYGDADRTASITIGQKVFMLVDNATKQMQVFIDDQLARTIPVSLGKPSTPSSSGFMVTMSHLPRTTFDTRGEPNGGYVVDVDWAMRLTWGGEFIHAAPWSVGDQGQRNVSHGCVNMSDANAKWLFDLTHVGDPIIVRGTEVPLENGNGWTAWNVTWAQFVQGSALPVPAELANAPAVDPITGNPPPPPAPEPTTDPSAGPSTTPLPGASVSGVPAEVAVPSPTR